MYCFTCFRLCCYVWFAKKILLRKEYDLLKFGICNFGFVHLRFENLYRLSSVNAYGGYFKCARCQYANELFILYS